MTAVFLPLGGQTLPRVPHGAPAMDRAAMSWSTHLAQALARGWFRGPLATVQASEPCQAAAVRAASATNVGLAQGGFTGASIAVKRAGASSVSSESRPSTSGWNVASPRATGAIAGPAIVLLPPAVPCESCLHGKVSHDAGERVARPRQAQGEAPRLHVHAENHADGVHVWVGAPLGTDGLAAALEAALLDGSLPGMGSVARLVVNGRDKGLAGVMRTNHEEDS